MRGGVSGGLITDPLDTGLLDRAYLQIARPDDPAQRAAFGKADDVREFGMMMLQCFLLPFARAGAAPLDTLRLRALCDGPFAKADAEGRRNDGVDIEALRDFLDAEDQLRIGGVGGVDVLDGHERSGWDLLGRMMAPSWEERPSARGCLRHSFWNLTTLLDGL